MNPSPPRISAAGYIRVSTEDQTEYSPDAQRRALERYAQQHGLYISPDHLFMDAGISGRRAETRPAFMAMIAAAKQTPPPFSVILVHKFDRFARNREDSIVYKSMLRRQCGVQVLSVTEHLEDDRMSLILEAMLEAMAEYYSLNLGDEVRKGMAEKARRGELQTAPPFGYRAEHNQLIPIPSEAVIVRELYRRFLNGASLASLARWTRQAGILTHRGNPMDTRQVRYILSNPVYRGALRWRPRSKIISSDPCIYPGKHQPLISSEEFDAAAALLHANQVQYGTHARPSEARKHWLSGLVRCAACGAGLIFSQPHFLKCGGYTKGTCTVSQHIPAERLERAILNTLRSDAAAAVPHKIHILSSRSKAAEGTLSQTLSGIQRKAQKLREAFLCGADSLQEYQQAKQTLNQEKQQLEQELIQQADTNSRSAEQFRQRAEQALLTLEDPTADTEAKYRAACRVLHTCIWDKSSGTVQLVYRWQLSE